MLAEGSFFHVYAEIDFPNGNPRYSCENGFLIDHDTQTLLYAAPSSQGQPIPAVRRLGDSALDNWKPAGNEIRLPDTLESIGPYALDGQYTGDFSPLAALILPDGVRELSDCSIYGCWEIQLLRFPATLTEIPAYCVANCGLGAVEIPEGVTRIGEFAFYILRLGADGIVRRHPARVGGICGLPRLPGRMRNHRAKPRHAL